MIRRILRTAKHLIASRLNRSTGFGAHRYQRHNQRRQEHLATLGLDIHRKRVLEVGAGVGDHTSFFLDRGCQVVCQDAREQNLKQLRARYPDLEASRLDIDGGREPAYPEPFDIVYCYGLLYHLRYPNRAIRRMSDWCRGLLLLETSVSYGDELELNPVREDAKASTQSYSGFGCRPTRPWVWRELERHFEHVYLPLTQPNHVQFPIDWHARPTDAGLVRSIFIASRTPLANDLLAPKLLMTQRRAP